MRPQQKTSMSLEQLNLPEKALMNILSTNTSTLSYDDRNSVHDLDYLINAIRIHLKMDVAFLSRFHDGQREILKVDLEPTCEQRLFKGDSSESNTTYCQLIANNTLPEVIPDTSKHPLTKNLAITKALNIGSYIGVPLNFSDGSIYGTLCCFSERPDPSLLDKDLSIIKLFATFAAESLENKVRENAKKKQSQDHILSMINEQSLSIAFQPIYDLKKQRVVGFECLSRFNTEPYHSPDYWFNMAQQVELGETLEMLAIETALTLLSHIPEPLYITLNISPKYVHSQRLHDLLNDAPLNRVILEVTEREIIEDYQAFRQALKPFRSKGMRLAVDDAGAGFASFQHILELEADIIKLDRSLICNMDSDRGRRALVAALISFAKEMGSRVLGEGVETKAEVDILTQLGAQKIQGYFFCHPLPLDEALEFSLRINNQAS